MNQEISHKKKRPEDLKIAKPLSLHPLTFEEAIDVVLKTKPRKSQEKLKPRKYSIFFHVTD